MADFKHGRDVVQGFLMKQDIARDASPGNLRWKRALK